LQRNLKMIRFINIRYNHSVMEREKVIDKLQKVAYQVLPKGSVLYLYGSRARGDYREDSDWDLLALLPEQNMSKDDKLNLSYDFWEQGLSINQDFNAFVYTQKEWDSAHPSLFKHNVQNERIKIWG